VSDVELSVSRWLAHRKPRTDARCRLFCLPYAGGAASIYREWQNLLPSEIEVCAIELPGRGVRFTDRPFSRMEALVPELAEGLEPMFDRPFAFFGHSMGAVIAYELARHLRARDLQPVHLFASAHRAPHLPDERDAIHKLDDKTFLAEIHELGGTPSGILDNDELLEIVLPILRVDFELVETYVHRKAAPLGCPITAFGGVADEHVDRDGLDAWREHTERSFSLRMLPGDHFFLHGAGPTITTFVARALMTPGL
jgi:medium-chain acyl-[acyl-carrier-protein] hydrolase